MADQILMPQMGFDMKEGKVVRWRKKVGDKVARGEIIAEIETDKANVEIEAFSAGTLTAILVQEGESAPVGQPIATLGDGPASAAAAPTAKAAQTPPSAAPPAPAPKPAEPPAAKLAEPEPAPAEPTPAAEPAAEQAPPAAALAEPVPPPAAPASRPRGGARTATAGRGQRIQASPIARRLAAELGVDLAEVHGSGPGGRIVRSDVEEASRRRSAPAPAPAAGGQPSAAPAEAERHELSRIRRALAHTMTASKAPVPHFYVRMSVDMAAALKLRQEINGQAAPAQTVSINDMVVKAAALALTRFRQLNASYEEDALVFHPDIAISIAVALEDGLVAPAIPGCDSKTLSEIARESKDLVARAKSGRLRAEEYTGTFTVSNLGMFEVDDFSAIITPPQAAALAVGAVREVPVVVGGAVTVGRRMSITLSADHRVTDGAQAAEFLGEVRRMLEQPLNLLL